MIAEIDEMLKSASTSIYTGEKPYLGFSFWQASSSSNLCFLLPLRVCWCAGVGVVNRFCNAWLHGGGFLGDLVVGSIRSDV